MEHANGNGHGGAAVIDEPSPSAPREDVSSGGITAALATAGTLVPKLAQVLGEMSRIPKNGRHPQGWSFSTESDIADMVRPELAERGLIMLPQLRNHHQAVIGRTSKGADIVRHTVDVDYLITDGESTIVIPWRGQADDSSDKGLAKALTAAQKYLLIRLFQLSSGDDADGHDAQADMEPRQRGERRNGNGGGSRQAGGPSREEKIEERRRLAQDRAAALGIEDIPAFFAALKVDHPDKLGSDAVWKAIDAELTRREDEARSASEERAPSPTPDSPAAAEPAAEPAPARTPQAARGSENHALQLKRRGLTNRWGLPAQMVNEIRVSLGIEWEDLHLDPVWEKLETELQAAAQVEGLAPPEDEDSGGDQGE